MKISADDITIRPMDPVKDIAVVFQLFGLLHQHEAESYKNLGVDIRPPQFDIEDYNVDLILVPYNGLDNVAGMIVTRASGNFADTASIADFVLFPEWRAQGIGGVVLQYTLESMKKERIKYANLNVRADNEAALALYHKLGFKPRGYYMMKEL